MCLPWQLSRDISKACGEQSFGRAPHRAQRAGLHNSLAFSSAERKKPLEEPSVALLVLRFVIISQLQS